MTVNLALLGHGTVGSGVAETLLNKKDFFEKSYGISFELKYVFDKIAPSNLNYSHLFTSDIDRILDDPSVTVIIECLSANAPAYDWCKKALSNGKHVITSNKFLVAEYGTELISLAKEKNVNFLFEASVGGGIPCINSVYNALHSNRIHKIYGIINGTTNYILSSMEKDHLSFDESLSKAQSFGYAELNPESDVLGYDTVRKIAILGETAWHHEIDYKKIPTIGITNISADDIKLANNAGYCIKLIGNIQRKESKIYGYVMPCLIPKNSILSTISGCTNALVFESDTNEPVIMIGAGAGKNPTASSLISDLLECSQSNQPVKNIYWDNNDNLEFISVPLQMDYMYYCECSSSLAESFFKEKNIETVISNCELGGCYIVIKNKNLFDQFSIKSDLKYLGETFLGIPIIGDKND